MVKGTRVMQQEKEQMWQLSRYVREFEAAVGAAKAVLNAK